MKDESIRAAFGAVTADATSLGIFDLIWGTKGDNSALSPLSERMRMTAAGNLGIGTNNPQSKFHVPGGDIKVSGGQIILDDTQRLVWPDGAGTVAIEGSKSPSYLKFTTGNTERIRIDSSGNVGMGTDNPQAKLDVQGTVKAQAFLGDGSGLTNLNIPQAIQTTSITVTNINVTSISVTNVVAATMTVTDHLKVGRNSVLIGGSATGIGNEIVFTDGPASIITGSGTLKIHSYGDSTDTQVRIGNPPSSDLLRTLYLYRKSPEMRVRFETNTSGLGGPMLEMVRGSDAPWEIFLHPTLGNLVFFQNYNNPALSNNLPISMTETGSVGIGTDAPSSPYKLDVRGDAIFDNAIFRNSMVFNKLGIGTSSPQSALDVRGLASIENITASHVLANVIENGELETTKFVNIRGWQNNGQAQLTLSGGYSENFVPGYSTASFGGYALSGAGSIGRVAFNKETSNQSLVELSGRSVGEASGNFFIGTANNGIMNHHLVVASTGNIGIGTLSPVSTLDIRGDAISLNGNPIIRHGIDDNGNSIVTMNAPLTIGDTQPLLDGVTVRGGVYVRGGLNITGSETIGGNSKVFGNLDVSGSKSFVQNHPNDLNKEIVFYSLEGPEVGTYARGSAKLINGEAIIFLPETFFLVTSTSEIITAQVTPAGDCEGLFVANKSSQQIVVRELNNGVSNAEFDYLVQGVRKRFENSPTIRTKQ